MDKTDIINSGISSAETPPADVLISKITDQIFNPIIGLLITIALVMFIYGVIEFIMGADNEEKREQGKQHIIWGLIGLFIMIAVTGILQVVQNLWTGF